MNHNILFTEDSFGKWRPRSVFIDCESENVNSMLNSEDTKGLVEPENCVSGHEAGVYETRSHYTIGKDLVD